MIQSSDHAQSYYRASANAMPERPSLGADLSASAWAALITTIALLAIYSFIAGARGGLDTTECLACAAAGAGVGLLVVALKVALH